VEWKVQQTDGGQVDQQGNYVAPAAEGEYHVVATVPGEGEAHAVVTVRRRADLGVSVQPAAASVAAGASLRFSAAVVGEEAPAVTW
jgi:hypothetical protein